VTSDQLSPDSASAGLHDAHRGAGSFDWARAGIELLRARGFTVKVAATIDEADAAEEQQLRALLDADGIPREDQLVRRVARTGFAEHGVQLTIDALWPEPTLAADGGWWHPVGVADPAMQVASTPLPLATTLASSTPRSTRAAPIARRRCRRFAAHDCNTPYGLRRTATVRERGGSDLLEPARANP